MKKISFVIIILSLSILGFGQVGFGLKGGVSLSGFPTDMTTIENSLGAGLQGGAYLRFGKEWHLQPEVYFTSKRGTLKYDINTSKVEQEIILNAVDVPILVGWKIINPPLMNIRLQAGPVASIVTKKKFNATFDGVKQDEPSDAYKDAFSDLNWGVQVGAGVDVLFLTIDLRYEIGLNNIYNNPDNLPDSPFTDLKNNLLFLSVGWKIM